MVHILEQDRLTDFVDVTIFKQIYYKWLEFIPETYNEKVICPFKDITDIWTTDNKNFKTVFSSFLDNLDLDFDYKTSYVPSAELKKLMMSLFKTEDDRKWLNNYNTVFLRHLKDVCFLSKRGRKRKSSALLFDEFKNELRNEMDKELRTDLDKELRAKLDKEYHQKVARMNAEFNITSDKLKEDVKRLKLDHEQEKKDIQQNFDDRKKLWFEQEARLKTDFSKKQKDFETIATDYEVEIKTLKEQYAKLEGRITNLRKLQKS